MGIIKSLSRSLINRLLILEMTRIADQVQRQESLIAIT